jgi:hypothetical protein
MEDEMAYQDLNQGEKFIYDWQEGKSGGFMTALAELMSRADNLNLDKLAEGYPDEVEGFRSYNRIRGWWKFIQLKAAT